jgi:hypothetical protein
LHTATQRDSKIARQQDIKIADSKTAKQQYRQRAETANIYISLQLCKMTDARASHINAKQGTIKDSKYNKTELNYKTTQIKSSTVFIVSSVAIHIRQPPNHRMLHDVDAVFFHLFSWLLLVVLPVFCGGWWLSKGL